MIFFLPYLDKRVRGRKEKSNLDEVLIDTQFINVCMMNCYSIKIREYLLIKRYIDTLKLLKFIVIQFKYYSEV